MKNPKLKTAVAVLLALTCAYAYAQVGLSSGKKYQDFNNFLVAGGDHTPVNVDATGRIQTSDPTAGVGYATGAGGAVTQITSRTTGVTLNTICGKVTTTADSMAAQAPTTFTVTDAAVAATDVVVVSKLSGDVDSFAWVNSTAAGSFTVTLFNSHASAADTTAFVFNFAVIKAKTS